MSLDDGFHLDILKHCMANVSNGKWQAFYTPAQTGEKLGMTIWA